MTDRYKVYTKVLKSIKEVVKDQHPGHTITLAMMITGIVLSKKAQLSEMSSEIPSAAKTKGSCLVLVNFDQKRNDSRRNLLIVDRQFMDGNITG